jgi:molybdopterin converting factor small subunit
MKIKIFALGAIPVEGTDESGYLELAPHTTVRQLLQRADLDEEVREHLPVIVNGKLAGLGDTLQAGDEITLVLPPTGG